MTSLTNLVQFPGLGLEFTINRVAFSIGSIAHLLVRCLHRGGPVSGAGVCVPALSRSSAWTPDAMVDVILIGVVLGIASARPVLCGHGSL